MRRPVFPRPIVVAALAFTGVAVAITLVVRRVHQHSGYCGTEPVSPVAIVARRDGSATYVACAGTSAALALDRAGRIMRRIALPAPPSGLALSPDETRLAVTCGAAESIVCLVDLASGASVGQWRAGHSATAPVFSPDGATLHVCNRFEGAVGVFGARSGHRVARIEVGREPIAAALTPDGRTLLVANHLPHVPSNSFTVASGVSAVDLAKRRTVATIVLPNGSGLAGGRLSPAALRGQRLFTDPQVGCSTCHPAPLFTDLRSYDVGTRWWPDRSDARFDTPTLVEVWRTAPYLHDGSVLSVRDVLTVFNREDRHGRTSDLTAAEIDDLAAYVLSL